MSMIYIYNACEAAMHILVYFIYLFILHIGRHNSTTKRDEGRDAPEKDIR